MSELYPVIYKKNTIILAPTAKASWVLNSLSNRLFSEGNLKKLENEETNI